ncbi:MAG: TIGR03943 family protein [Cyanobacteria bacterium J06641_5]
MTQTRQPTRNRPSQRRSLRFNWTDLVPVLWGVLLLKYWLTGQLSRLIHPNFNGLIAVTGGLLLALGSLHWWQGRRSGSQGVLAANLVPGKLATGLLIGTAIAGLIIPPGTLGSQAALQRGLGSTLPVTRLRPQPFQIFSNTEERSLVDWVRTLNAYPEPTAYSGQPVRIEGFVMRLDELPTDAILVARFIVSCCAVDAYPVALPVQLPPGTQARDFQVDSWVRISGAISPLELPGQARQASVKAAEIVPIPTPRDPYSF